MRVELFSRVNFIKATAWWYLIEMMPEFKNSIDQFLTEKIVIDQLTVCHGIVIEKTPTESDKDYGVLRIISEPYLKDATFRNMVYGPEDTLHMKAIDPVKFANEDVYAGILLLSPLSIEEALTHDYQEIRRIALQFQKDSIKGL